MRRSPLNALILLLALPLAVGTACGPGDNATKDDDEEVIGKPPAPENDPFAFRAMPDEAQEVSTSGTIGEESDSTDRDREERGEKPVEEADVDEVPDAKDEGATDDGSESGGESKEAEAVASKPQESPERVEEKSYQCFSCVRVCPVDGDCDKAKEDLICGWGVHSSRPKARKLATAECDATLDMARQMPVWSRIEGSCPVATCRE